MYWPLLIGAAFGAIAMISMYIKNRRPNPVVHTNTNFQNETPISRNEDENCDRTIQEEFPINWGPQRECNNCREYGKSLRTLPCGHEFHLNCIDGLLEDTFECPVCQYDLKKRT